MRKFNLLVVLVLGCLSVFSQENSIYINDYLAPYMTNPACTGAEYYPVANLSVKKQWLGFSGSPNTFVFAGNFRIGSFDFYNPKGLVNKGRFKSKNRVGLGMAIFQDNDGPIINNGGLFSYAYHLPVNRKSRLALGMSLILNNHRVSTSMLEPNDSNDPYLLSEEEGGYSINMGAGVYYHNSTYFFGMSANKLLRDKLNVIEGQTSSINIFLFGGYKFFKDNKNINYEPSISIKRFYDQEYIFTLNNKVYVNRLNWMALSVSSIKQMNIRFAQKMHRRFYVGYGFEFTMGKIAAHNYGTHEISLGLNMGLVGIEGIKKLANVK